MPPILSKLPAELNDLVFKFIPVTFRRTLKNVALSCKDGFRRSYAKMHNTVVLRGVGIEQGEMTPDMCNPARTFEELIELAHWCVNIPPFAKILAIRGPTSRYHTEHMAQGVALCEEEISSCQVCEVLELFPDVERLIIDNVAWADCDPNNDPDCTAGMDRRVFEGITIRAVERNCHYGHPYAVLEAVKIVAHLVLGTLHGYVGDVDLSDTQVDWLTLDEVGYFDPYQFAALATLEPNSVERLDLFGMGASRVPSVMELLAAQKDSVKTLAFDIATPVISTADLLWVDLAIDLPALESFTIYVHVPDEWQRLEHGATHEVFNHVVQTLPPTLRHLSLHFEVNAYDVAIPSIVLSTAAWTTLNASLRQFVQLESWEVNIDVSVRPGKEGGHHETFRAACREYVERRLPVIRGEQVACDADLC